MNPRRWQAFALDLAKAYLSGEAAYQHFKINCLEPEKPLVKFHETLKKQKFKTFRGMSKAKTKKTRDKKQSFAKTAIYL